MQKDDLIYLGHMLDMCEKAREKIADKSREDFDDDENLRMALAHLIQIIGEAARRVSPDFQARHSEIPWRQIVGMRHKVVHDYMHVDFDIVWGVVSSDLPGLLDQLRSIIQEQT